MNTNSSNAEKKQIKVTLPNGNVVDITTKEGANALLKDVSNFDYFSFNLKEIRKLRKKKYLNKRKENKLVELYDFINNLASNADREVFREKIPESEIQDLLDYVIDEIKGFGGRNLLKSSDWLNDSDMRVLECCNPMFERHVVPVKLAFKCGLFQVLATFLKGPEGFGRTLPHAIVCDHIGRIAFDTLVTASVLTSWSMDKIFEKFEASGFLEQLLRCYTIPHKMGSEPDYLQMTLGELHSCTRILTRKFKRGKPCGNTLQAILDGQEGSTNIEPRALDELKGLARIAETMDPREFTARLASGTCSFCSKKSDDDLRFCDRCGFVLYCSKECQRAHWDTHKQDCRKISTAERDRTFSLHLAISKSMNENYKALFEEMDRICDSKGLEPRDLLVLLDFIPGDGNIPALDGPYNFWVLPIRVYAFEIIPMIFGFKPRTDLQRAWCQDMVKQVLDAKRKSSSGVLVAKHANRFCIDTETLELYRQAGSSPGDIHMKLGSIWCSSRLTVFHGQPQITFDSQVIDSSYELL